MKTKLLISMMAVLAGLLMGGAAMPTATAEAKIHYTTMPKSFKGTWVNVDDEDPAITHTLKITKYVYHYQSYYHGRKDTLVNWSGKKKSHYYNHSDLSVKKEKHAGTWRISWYRMNSIFDETIRKVNHKGKPALVFLDHFGDGTPQRTYFYKK
ncbi:hypothetical protein [Levilactobacillus sp. N40-8-2]|uniref:hypothetical protein n=1 Tax=Levilactobacillus muriae TaxID=3238987 RepID=UPI0038B3E37B